MIEDLIVRLRDDVAVVIVTHNLQQASRVADNVAFMYLGELVEYGDATATVRLPSGEANDGVHQRCVRLIEKPCPFVGFLPRLRPASCWPAARRLNRRRRA